MKPFDYRGFILDLTGKFLDDDIEIPDEIKEKIDNGIDNLDLKLQKSRIYPNEYRNLRARVILKLRYCGFTLQSIGNIFSLSKERIREIQGRSLRALRRRNLIPNEKSLYFKLIHWIEDSKL